uniref:Uncharacterized protein n=1 Tax=Glossina austeni TaxID=7395 RepID=A0A1A9UFK0_GLOAU
MYGRAERAPNMNGLAIYYSCLIYILNPGVHYAGNFDVRFNKIRMRLHVLTISHIHAIDALLRLNLLRKGSVIMQMNTITRTYEKTLRKRIKRNEENFENWLEAELFLRPLTERSIAAEQIDKRVQNKQR